jgi:hypothetical protein
MLVERRGWATRVKIGLVNWRQEEPTGCDREGPRFMTRSKSGSVRGSG